MTLSHLICFIAQLHILSFLCTNSDKMMISYLLNRTFTEQQVSKYANNDMTYNTDRYVYMDHPEHGRTFKNSNVGSGGLGCGIQSLLD